MIRKVLGGIVIYSILIYMVIEFGPQYDFRALTIDPPGSLRSTPLFLLIGGVFWLLYDIVRYILKIVAIPFNFITFGIVNIIINVGMIYIFPYVINYANIGVTITLGTLTEIIILAFLLGIFGFFLKYL